MAITWWRGPPPAEAGPGHSQQTLLAAAAGAPPGLPDGSIASLAAQWREAHAIAEAQERRLAALETAAAALWSGDRADREGGDIVHDVQLHGERWWRETEAIDASLGLPAMTASANSAWEVVQQLADRLLALRPMDVAEAALKFGVLMTVLRGEAHDAEGSERLHAFLEDLQQLAGVPAADHLPRQ